MIGSYLYTIIISPIELLVEVLFVVFYKAFDNYGLAIAGISIFVSLFTLPLYTIAERIQKKERDQRKAMDAGIRRIKTVFYGDERYLILSTYYRQNHYHPVYALRSSISLLIQIPFFIAAYHFLSHLTQLQGEGFFILRDLGVSDSLVQFGSVTINVLPILMTAINIISGLLYTKGYPLRDKVQLFSMAGLFLVLLYNSPAGLVYYWTLNNLFSLAKNVVLRFRNPLKVLFIGVTSVSFGAVLALMIMKPEMPLVKKVILVSILAFICLIPLLGKIFSRILEYRYVQLMKNGKLTFQLFLASSILLWLLHGLLIPSNLIGASPIEFSNIGSVANPLSHLVYPSLLFMGLWVVWPSMIFFLSKPKIKVFMSIFLFLVSTSSLLNFFGFSGEYGTLNPILVFDNPDLLKANLFQSSIPILLSLCCVVCVDVIIKFGHSKTLVLLSILLVVTTGLSASIGIHRISMSYDDHVQNLETYDAGVSDRLTPIIALSKEGKNVVVLFLDRAISSFLPIIFHEFPHLEKQFSGFVYYPNTVSFGGHTVTGAPPILGGYEYTPDEMNNRKSEALVDKHNEATLVLPRLFSQSGFEVTVLDPPLPNYKWSDDFSAFLPYPEIKVSSTKGRYSEYYSSQHMDEVNIDESLVSELIRKKAPMYSFLRSCFPLLRGILYDEGKYFLMLDKIQVPDLFIDSYSVLHYLPELTTFSGMSNSYVFLANDTAHTPIFLQSPEYIPVGNPSDVSNPLQKLDGYNEMDQMHYHANVAALLQIGKWLEYLKTNGVYDNTRVVIVADHGSAIHTPIFKDFTSYNEVLGYYNPLFLVKDFYANEEFSRNMNFMTNADAALYALHDIIKDPTNPFTGKKMNDQVQKMLVNVYETPFEPGSIKGSMFEIDKSKSFSVKDSIFIEENWKQISIQ